VVLRGFENFKKVENFIKKKRSGKDIIIPDVLRFMCICWTMSSHLSSKNNSQLTIHASAALPLRMPPVLVVEVCLSSFWSISDFLI